MRLKVLKSNLKPIQKICLSGLFIALVAILQKILAINYIPVVPFLRISLGGPALIIFSSIFLGPIYGLFIGVASDVIGYFLFDPKMMGYSPQISVIYGVLGFLSFFIFFLIQIIKNDKWMLVIEGITFVGIIVGVAAFLLSINNLQTYSGGFIILPWQKVLIPSIMTLLFAGLFVSTLLFKKHFQKDQLPLSPAHISFCCLIIEIIVMVILGSIMKGWLFGFKIYPAILVCQLIVLFVNVPLNTWLICLFLKLTKRFYQNNV